jgi:hypothetical protein
MGAALTYARRYALFALVGIAGEDDLDAPDIIATEPSLATNAPNNTTGSVQASLPNCSIQRKPKPVLAAEQSAALRDQLLAEIADLRDGDELAFWAHRRLPAKNTLAVEDAFAVEVAFDHLLSPSKEALTDYASALNGLRQTLSDGLDAEASENSNPSSGPNGQTAPEDELTWNKTEVAFPLIKTVRKRNKAHLRFVAAEPCLICKRSPCDAHHLKFAQQRSLGGKVSDEFTVPLCRDHHEELHRFGNEAAWWANVQIEPMLLAKELWTTTLSR